MLIFGIVGQDMLEVSCDVAALDIDKGIGGARRGRRVHVARQLLEQWIEPKTRTMEWRHRLPTAGISPKPCPSCSQNNVSKDFVLVQRSQVLEERVVW